MTQYDAGPGEWSDRPWDDPDKKPKPQAKRRRVALPPWALMAILVAIVILLCVGLALIVRALRDGGDEETGTPTPTAEVALTPTATVSLVRPTLAIPATSTVVLPVGTPVGTAIPAAIAPGVMVVVTGTGGAGLNLREQPTTYAKRVGSAREGTVLIVLEGPRDSDGHMWWRLRTPDSIEGWGAAEYLVLKTEE